MTNHKHNRAARLRREAGIPSVVILQSCHADKRVIYIGQVAHTATYSRGGWVCGDKVSSSLADLARMLMEGG